jgi:hypothetical protein
MEQVGNVVETLTGAHPSPSTVSRVFHSLEGEFENWKKRSLRSHYLYAFADGTYLSVIYDKTGCKMPILAVIGIDETTGTLTNLRVWLQTPEGAGTLDGMTVDAQSYIWSARWDGVALYRYTPDGIEERRYDFPALKVSSVIFGGEDLQDI